MVLRVLTIVVVAAASLGCQKSVSSTGPSQRRTHRVDAAAIEFITFDEVKEKVWDTDRGPPPLIDKSAFHRALRAGLRTCLCPKLPGLVDELPNDFLFSLSMDVDGDANYTTRLGRFTTHTEEPGSRSIRVLAKIEKCIEMSIRTAGFDRKAFGGRLFSVRYPFHHGIPCAEPAGCDEQ
jgi:hypothetical protein